MTIDELQATFADLFPTAVANAAEYPDKANLELDQIKKLCWQLSMAIVFSCKTACFEASMPRRDGELTVTACSTAKLIVLPWTFRVNCRTFFRSSSQFPLPESI